MNFVVDGRIFRLSDIATVRRGYSDPPQPMFRYNGVPAIGLGIAMRSGGDVLALGRNVGCGHAHGHRRIARGDRAAPGRSAAGGGARGRQ